jgi:hypothetical protein
MILVVFIMGTLATISMSFIESEDSQWRYDESLRKMAMVRDAVLKVRDYKSQQIMSGFVFDNGRLPDNTGPFDQLIGPSTLQTFEEKEPYFFYNFGTSAVKLSDFSDSSNPKDAELTLFKGYRSGAYLSFGLDSPDDPSDPNDFGEFRDGWGNNFDVSPTVTTYTVKLNDTPTAPYNNQPKIRLRQHNWSISLDQINYAKIKLVNSTGGDFPPTKSPGESGKREFYIVLFVYVNNSTSGKNEWVNYQSSLITLDTNLVAPESPTPMLEGEISEHELTLKLEDGIESPVSSTDLIPAGNHLLVLIDKNKLSGIPDDGLISYQNGNLDEPSYQKFTLFPGSSLPELTLTIKE